MCVLGKQCFVRGDCLIPGASVLIPLFSPPIFPFSVNHTAVSQAVPRHPTNISPQGRPHFVDSDVISCQQSKAAFYDWGGQSCKVRSNS